MVLSNGPSMVREHLACRYRLKIVRLRHLSGQVFGRIQFWNNRQQSYNSGFARVLFVHHKEDGDTQTKAETKTSKLEHFIASLRNFNSYFLRLRIAFLCRYLVTSCTIGK